MLPPAPAIADLDATGNPANLGTTTRNIAIPHATAARAPSPAFTANLQRYGINQFASPHVVSNYLEHYKHAS
jgi:hypothetical protein